MKYRTCLFLLKIFTLYLGIAQEIQEKLNHCSFAPYLYYVNPVLFIFLQHSERIPPYNLPSIHNFENFGGVKRLFCGDCSQTEKGFKMVDPSEV